MLDPVSISVSLIFFLFLLMQSEKQREDTTPWHSFSQPAHHLNSESEISEPANKQQVNKRRKSSNTRWECPRKKENWGWYCEVCVWREGAGELEVEIRTDGPSVELLKQKQFLILNKAINLNKDKCSLSWAAAASEGAILNASNFKLFFLNVICFSVAMIMVYNQLLWLNVQPGIDFQGFLVVVFSSSLQLSKNDYS